MKHLKTHDFKTVHFSLNDSTNKNNNNNQKYFNKTNNFIIKKNDIDKIEEENEEEINNSNLYHKKRRNNINKDIFKKEKGLSTISTQIKEEFSLDKLGKIEWAKEHSSANKPMNKIKEFTESTKFCRCCNLPIKTPGIIEPFSFCENIENFSVCGKAVSLYFYFYLYCIAILTMVFITMSLPITVFNYSHLSNIEGYCTYLKNNNFTSFNREININDICDKYLEINNNEYI